MADPTHTGYVRIPPLKWEEVVVARSGSYEASLRLLLDACKGLNCDLYVREISKGDPNKDKRAY